VSGSRRQYVTSIVASTTVHIAQTASASPCVPPTRLMRDDRNALAGRRRSPETASPDAYRGYLFGQSITRLSPPHANE